MEGIRKSCGRASCPRAKWSDTGSRSNLTRRGTREQEERDSNLTLRVSPVPLTIGISGKRKAEKLRENIQCASRCRFVCRGPSTLDVQLLLQSDTLLFDIRDS